MISSRMDRFPASALARQFRAVATGSRYMRTLARPRAVSVLARVRVDLRQRPVRVVAGQVPVPQLLAEGDRGRAADLLQPDLVRKLGRLGVGRRQHERRRGQDLELIGRPAVLCQPSLDVGVERLPGRQRANAG